MAVTETSLRKRLRAELYSAMPQTRPYTDVLTADILAAGTTLSVSDGANWTEGDIVDFETDGDQAIVTAVAGNDLTIRRLTGATGHSTGDSVTKNPRFTVEAQNFAVETVIEDLYPQVWKITTIEDAFDQAADWYPIANDKLRQILTVYYKEPSYGIPVAVPGWQQVNGVDSGDFTNTQGVILPRFLPINQADPIFFVFREEIDDVTDLLDRQEGLVAKGAVYHLMNEANVVRTNDHGRWTDRTVQPGQEARDAIPFLRDFTRMLRNEELRLLDEESRLPLSQLQQRARRFRR